MFVFVSLQRSRHLYWYKYWIQYILLFLLSLLKISELYIISKSYGGPYKKHIIIAHVIQQTTPYRLYYYCSTDAGVPGANIGDQSRACETRSCLFLCPCIGVDICTDIHTEYNTLSCFVSLLKFSELYTISKSHGRTVLKAGYQSPCTGWSCQVCFQVVYSNTWTVCSSVMIPNTLRDGNYPNKMFRIHTHPFVRRLHNVISHWINSFVA